MADTAKFSFPRLSNTNWNVWKFRVEMLLTREDLFHTIDEAKPEPVTPQWTKEDKKARATIGLAIEDNQLGLIKNATSARAMWTALKTHHEKATVTSRVSLLKKLCNKNLHEGGDMEAHLLDIEELFDRLQASGLELEQEMKVAMVLRSLPDTYSGLATALESRPDDDITMELIKSKLRDENQKRMDREASPDDSKALRTSTKDCFYCGKPGHYRKNCRKYLAFLKEEEDCESQPESTSSRTSRNSKGAKAKQAQDSGAPVCFRANAGVRGANVIAEEEMKCCSAKGSKSDWFIDSGASRHMTSNRTFFTELVQDVQIDVTLANGKKTVAAGVGNGMLVCVNEDGKKQEVKVQDVLYVPELEGSLLSVSMLVAKDFSVVFDSHGCRVRDTKGQAVAVGDLRGGMYLLRCSERSMVTGTARYNDICRPKNYDVLSKKKLDCGVQIACKCCHAGRLRQQSFPKAVQRRVKEVQEDPDEEDEVEQDGKFETAGQGVNGIRRSQASKRDVPPQRMDNYGIGEVGLATYCGGGLTIKEEIRLWRTTTSTSFLYDENL